MSQTAEDLANPSVSEKVETPLRFVTAASLFDGHDAAINLMRRLIQAEGCEVVHLGHNRSVADIVRAAICEHADGIAVSSYQGGHNEFFKYMVDMLAEQGAGHIQVFGGGGGTITPEEIQALEAHGVNRIYHPQDGMKMGLTEMISDLVERTAKARRVQQTLPAVDKAHPETLAAVLTALENGLLGEAELKLKRREWAASGGNVPVIGLTGTGGAGKSSVTDELISRFLQFFPDMNIAVLAVDPTRRRTGGALLGDRIRMNTLRSDRVFMRSMATRRAHMATSEVVRDCVALLRASGFDLVILETAGIGQSDSEVVDLVDFPVYVMTSEYGAASQLEKIDMLDFAELVILNKFDRQGSQDALRDVRKQWRRNRLAFQLDDEQTPVYPTIASQFNDPGVTWMFANLCRLLLEKAAKDGGAEFGTDHCDFKPAVALEDKSPKPSVLIPAKRVRYLAEIAEQGRGINDAIAGWTDDARRAQHYFEVLNEQQADGLPAPLGVFDRLPEDDAHAHLAVRYNELVKSIPEPARDLLRSWPALKASVESEQFTYQVRDKTITGANYRESLSRLQIPKIAAPQTGDWGDLLTFLMKENLPGHYPYTGGVYPYRRTNEDPIRMFAGEGTPERTNRRFHYLSEGQDARRLSTAFDSVTLYGEDPHKRPDI